MRVTPPRTVGSSVDAAAVTIAARRSSGRWPAGDCRRGRPSPAPHRRAPGLGGQLAATAPGRTARDRSACRRRRPCPASCRGRPRRLRRRGCRRRSESETEVGGPGVEAAAAASSAPAMTAPATAAARISAPVLRACMSAQAGGVERGRGPAPCGRRRRRSMAWPPTMPLAPAARGHDGDHPQLASDERRRVPCGLARQQREGLGLQAVTRQDRHAVADDHVQRRPTAAQRVVVHRRQVVVDERIGVNQLERAGGGQGLERAVARSAPRAAATASAAASTRIGRRRLPPAITL